MYGRVFPCAVAQIFDRKDCTVNFKCLAVKITEERTVRVNANRKFRTSEEARLKGRVVLVGNGWIALKIPATIDVVLSDPYNRFIKIRVDHILPPWLRQLDRYQLAVILRKSMPYEVKVESTRHTTDRRLSKKERKKLAVSFIQQTFCAVTH